MLDTCAWLWTCSAPKKLSRAAREIIERNRKHDGLVVSIISAVFIIQPHILEHGTSSVSSLIALNYQESTPFAVSALMAAGLALFAMTLLVNFLAAIIVSRSRSGAASEA